MNPPWPRRGPFSLDDEAAYRHWRDRKLADPPAQPDDLRVRVKDPRALSSRERSEILRRVARANLALFAWDRAPADSETLLALLSQLGLRHLDRNLEAAADGVTEIAVRPGPNRTYIPYTNRPLSWHTDGYYNPPGRQVRAWALYCVQDAAEGGTNQALDHEVAYIRLRDHDPAWIAALMAPEAMTIPPNAAEEGTLRDAQSGPVFSVDPRDGRLHMRYSARQRNIVWHADLAARQAAEALLALFSRGDDHILTFRLAPGEGILSNNVLHRRDGFRDEPDRPRTMLRARYYDAIDGA